MGLIKQNTERIQLQLLFQKIQTYSSISIYQSSSSSNKIEQENTFSVYTFNLKWRLFLYDTLIADNLSHLVLLQLVHFFLTQRYIHFFDTFFIYLANCKISEIGLCSFVDFQSIYSSLFFLTGFCLPMPNYRVNLTCTRLFLSNT